ncbi:MAG TPA: NAD(P)/FAD-dependent oxidoreductase [Armatimonadota bacterium]|nr:NAD(P)/FAD-dependent oxidoreductase [Armatimonadota bacterium]
MEKYDVIIVGAGPAGIFAALELSKVESLKVIILDKGSDIEERLREVPRSLLCGWGGAGAFSDGKLTLSTQVGGQLTAYVPEEEAARLIKYVDQTYVDFGAPEKVYGTNEDEVNRIARKAVLADLKLIPSAIRHVGTDQWPDMLRKMREVVEKRVDVRMETAVSSILTREGKATGVETASGETIEGRYVIIAPGREGADWLLEEARRLDLESINNPVDVGVRVELPAPVLEELTDAIYEPKLVFYSPSFDDKVRSFCVCPYGEVVVEYNDSVTTVNGHSYANKKTKNTNFALLVSTMFTEPFREPITYGRYIASLSNLLSGSVIVQRLGDLMEGRRSTWSRIEHGLVEPTLKTATPGDLSFVLPYRHLGGIMEMIEAMDKLAPGVASRHTLLYGVEVKFYSSRLTLTPSLETDITNLFTIGDGAGVTRGLVQSSASGVIAAREIIKRGS